MAEKLTWIFEMIDRASNPLGKISKGLTKFDRQMQNAGGAMKGFEKQSSGASDAFAGWGMSALGAVKDVGLAVVGMAAAGGKFALESFAFKENTMAAFKTMLKSDEAARRVMNSAIQFAAETPFSTEEVVSSYQKLLTAGFKEVDLKKIMMNVGDVGAAFGPDAMASTIRAFAQIKAKGKFQGEEMMQLAEAGVSTGAVYDALGKKFGKTRDQIQKMISAGKIGANEGIDAVMQSITDGISGGKSGSLMAAKANTISGLMSTLSSKPFEFMIALDEQSMLKPIKEFITTLTAVLSPETDTGKRIVAILQTVGDAVSSIFGGTGDADAMAKAIGKVLDVVEPLTKMLIGFGTGFFTSMGKGLGPLFEKLGAMSPEKLDRMVKAFIFMGEAIGFMIRNAVLAAAGFAWLFDTMIGMTVFLWELPGKMIQLGVDLVQGFIDGIKSMLPSVEGILGGSTGGLASRAIEVVSQALGRASPSKVFADIGVDTAQGFINGVQGMGSNVSSALGSMVDLKNPFGSASSVPGAAGAPGAGGQTITIYVQPGSIIIQGGGDGKQAQSLEMALGDMFHKAAGQLGAG